MQQAYTAEQLAAICGGDLVGNGHAAFTYVTTDTRKPGFPADTLFVAIAGSGRDGAAFVPPYYRLGGRIFLVPAWEDHWLQDAPEASFVVVADTRLALHQLAAHHRRLFRYPVVGITGSNGKTIVKEWLHQALAPDYKIVRSPGSYNSQIGVPLSVLLMTPIHQLGIFEAGISQPGEMAALAAIIKPDIGILTNLGSAHDAGFAGKAEKLREKCLLFAGSNLILARGQEVLGGHWPQEILHKTKCWGTSDACDFQVKTQPVVAGKSSLVLVAEKSGGHIWQFTLPFSDDASVENAITTAIALRLLGIEADAIPARMAAIHPIAMRMTMEAGINNCRIINDSYSHDEHGLVLALNYWREQTRGHKTIIISDPGDMDAPVESLVALLQQQDLHRLVMVGPKLKAITLPSHTAAHVHVYATTAQLLDNLPDIGFHNETILIKGARRFGFESVAKLLTENRHQTVLEIDLNAIRDNLNTYRSRLAAGVKTMVMLKAFGYGSGDAEIAKMLEGAGVNYLAVAYPGEGIALRKAGIQLPIMVLNADEESYGQLISWNLEPEVYSMPGFHAFKKFAGEAGLKDFPVHIKIDTGMHRLGFLPAEVAELGHLLNTTDVMRVKSVFTHFIAAESADADEVSQNQIALFVAASNQLATVTGTSFLRHMANSHAILRFKEAHFDMVRLGIGLYGGAGGSKHALRLRTTIAQIKPVAQGEIVGYGLDNRMPHDGKIAVLRIGYADGLPRSLGRGAWQAIIKGQVAPTVGHICMDMCMVDISHISGLAEGDEAEIFGPANPLEDLAGAANTISYEIMTGISQRVPRRYWQ